MSFDQIEATIRAVRSSITQRHQELDNYQKNVNNEFKKFKVWIDHVKYVYVALILWLKKTVSMFNCVVVIKVFR